MVLPKKELSGVIINLTGRPVWTYSIDGDIICLEPYQNGPADFYLVPYSVEIDAPNLVVIQEMLRGRDDVLVAELVLRHDHRVRVYPIEGR